MTYEVKKLENSAVEIILKAEGEEVKNIKSGVLKNIQTKAEIPGFRKGKAPISAIETQFAGVLKEEVTDKLLQSHYEQIIKDENIKPVDFLKTKEVKLDGDNFEGTFTVEVYPEIELGEYKGLEVEKETFEMTDELLDQELNTMLEAQSKLKEADEGYKAQMGDTLDINFEGFVDGEPFEGGKAEGHELKLGSKTFIDTFEEQLVGYEAGQEGEVNVTFPEAYHAENLAGKPATFKVKVNAIKVVEKPELNDEFAKDNGFDSVEDLKAKKTEEIKAREAARIENAYKNALLQKVSDNTEVAVPQSMVQREVKARISEMEQQLKMQGASLDMYLKMTGMTQELMEVQIAPMATAKVKMDIILGEIAKCENIEISDEELEGKVADVAKMYNMESDKLKEELTKAGNLDNFLENVKVETMMQKTVDFIVDCAK
jgi:trigger factor